MKKKLGVAAAVALTLLLTACGISSGEIVDKHYEGPYTYTTMYCTVYIKAQCASYGTMYHHVDEKWVFTLENNEGKTGDVSVPKSDYDAIPLGTVYTKPE